MHTCIRVRANITHTHTHTHTEDPGLLVSCAARADISATQGHSCSPWRRRCCLSGRTDLRLCSCFPCSIPGKIKPTCKACPDRQGSTVPSVCHEISEKGGSRRCNQPSTRGHRRRNGHTVICRVGPALQRTRPAQPRSCSTIPLPPCLLQIAPSPLAPSWSLSSR